MKNLTKDSIVLAVSMCRVLNEYHYDSTLDENCYVFKDSNNESIIFKRKLFNDGIVIPVHCNSEQIKKQCYDFLLETPPLTELLVRRKSINEITTNLCKIGNTITTYDISSKDFKDINEKFNNLFEEINNKYGIC